MSCDRELLEAYPTQEEADRAKVSLLRGLAWRDWYLWVGETFTEDFGFDAIEQCAQMGYQTEELKFGLFGRLEPKKAHQQRRLEEIFNDPVDGTRETFMRELGEL